MMSGQILSAMAAISLTTFKHTSSRNYTAPNDLHAMNASVQASPPGTYGNVTGSLHVSWTQLGLNDMGISEIQDFSSGSLLGRQYCPLTIRPDDATHSSSQANY